MRKTHFWLFTVVLALVCASCVPYKKQVYFQYLEDRENDSVITYEQQMTQYRLQPYDILDIQITSPNMEAAGFFSQTFSTAGVANSTSMARMAGLGGDLFYMNGYFIDDNGEIKMPFLGTLNVAGKTIYEIRAMLEQDLLQYFNSENSFYVTVKLGGLRYTVTGEVMQPGRYVMLETRYNIYQALAQAGDLTVFANRNELWLIRQEGGKSKIYAIDLLSEEIMTSPLYYIQPNDIIYVRPLKAKQYGVGSTFLQNFTVTLSIFSTTLALINLKK